MPFLKRSLPIARCAIAHAYAAAYYLCQENAVDRRHAVPHLKAAQRHCSETTERERWFVEAIAAWARGDLSKATQLHWAIAQKYPQDLVSVQQGQYHYFYQGEAANLLQIAQTVLPVNPANHYLYGMVAFGLEQCGNLEQAEAIGRQAVALNRHDAWAQHAVAHVLESQGRVLEGIAWMESHADTWERCNSMLYTHNWWHIALYYLALGDLQTVLQLYRTHLWGKANKTSPKDQVGAIATLLRLEMRGVNVDTDWQELAPFLYARLHEHALPFQDLHYIYALTRAGYFDWAMEMLNSLHHIARIHSPQQQTWSEVVLPAATGMVACARGDWATAVTLMAAVLPEIHRIGGSRTQRELFQQIYQYAVGRSEHGTQPCLSLVRPSSRRPACITASNICAIAS
ncbi:tetratricopeptide repeat protein [Kovacikia minuta]|uniref:tetratricopeptide repeat protein n=1 Tax=Kovacikia minuta TaxID=2931930 RepID=UPI0028F41A2E|nr:tetratricopeptide repeat protein [Kovacikia minuta]